MCLCLPDIKEREGQRYTDFEFVTQIIALMRYTDKFNMLYLLYRFLICGKWQYYCNGGDLKFRWYLSSYITMDHTVILNFNIFT